ncbi:MAG: hypothetical protein E6Q68_07335 [Polynucleobacter sp.]|nr:MAG: hypothetical protein E6Q68_07335 [Polynucleobacter sp.]
MLQKLIDRLINSHLVTKKQRTGFLLAVSAFGWILLSLVIYDDISELFHFYLSLSILIFGLYLMYLHERAAKFIAGNDSLIVPNINESALSKKIVAILKLVYLQRHYLFIVIISSVFVTLIKYWSGEFRYDSYRIDLIIGAVIGATIAICVIPMLVVKYVSAMFGYFGLLAALVFIFVDASTSKVNNEEKNRLISIAVNLKFECELMLLSANGVCKNSVRPFEAEILEGFCKTNLVRMFPVHVQDEIKNEYVAGKLQTDILTSNKISNAVDSVLRDSGRGDDACYNSMKNRSHRIKHYLQELNKLYPVQSG